MAKSRPLTSPWGSEPALSAFAQLNLDKSSRSSRSTNLQDFRDGRSARPSDVFIALMGVTGSGKSSFISLCCDRVAEVGHELRACTTVVDVYAYELSASRTVYLVDTPGFDDTTKSDTEVLREIAGWLNASYKNRVLLHGIIYLHRIADVRMQGSAKKNLLMFKKLCGENALKKVVLATTMWDKVPQREAEEREKQLIETPEFWGFMVSKGSVTYRHNNTVESAVRIIEKLAVDNSKMTLDIQNQMVNENQNLVETAAGKELESELIKERQKWAAELKDAQEQIKEAIRLRDKESEQALQELRNDYMTRMESLERANERLHVDAERLHNERTKRLEMALEQQRKENAYVLEKLHQRDAQLGEASKTKDQASAHMPMPGSPTYRSPTSRERVLYDASYHLNLSVSIYGRHGAFTGPHSSIRIANVTSETLHDEYRFMVYGTSGSWIYKYRERGGTKYEIRYSATLINHYPTLFLNLRKRSNVNLRWICLGPGGTFFAKWEDEEAYRLPPNITSLINRVKDDGISAVALGGDATYIVVHGDKMTWDLKGHYEMLKNYLNTATSIPAFVALNPENKTDFVILFETLRFSLPGEFYVHLKTWAREHLIHEI